MQSTPESGSRAGLDGHKKKASKVRAAVDTLGSLMALAPENENELEQVAKLSADVQAATGENVEIAFIDQGCVGAEPAAAAGQPWDTVGGGEAPRT
jgi:hypothetical protein